VETGEEYMHCRGSIEFLVRDELFNLYLCVFCFRIVNETFTEASLAPGIDPLYSTNTILFSMATARVAFYLFLDF
jgi:hypothetical protein